MYPSIKEDSIVDLQIFNIAKIDNPLKKEFLHALLNEINDSYRYARFVGNENEIKASYSMPLIDHHDQSEIIFDLLIMLFECVEDEFPKFMKLQWS